MLQMNSGWPQGLLAVLSLVDNHSNVSLQQIE